MEIHLTVDELVEYLKRSSLTTVIVEGKDDIIIYRWIEEKIGITNASFLSCGGRDKLLQIFERRDEFSHIKTVFVADKDCFVYSSIPQQYNDLVWTRGYSIENDLYHGRFVEKLLNVNEEVNFRIALKNFITYYAFEVESYNKKVVYNFSNHPNQVLTDKHELNQVFLQSINYNEPSANTIRYLQEEYDLLIRGKSLFALLLRFLSHSRRDIKHSKLGLLESCYKLSGQNTLNEVIERIKEKLYA